ncbi:anti-sigma factor family protein [Ideonella oryzae]|uniref:Anti-sigma factor n=1 Tax=Ideonella oryzae TaxID=2937441 RepID=A0ABT1BS38_9BURK|nr:anti-sigma factor [Ideonella oryzae]MCO5979005.1 anti-sigma factor [Ideonella oryzae]
MDTEHPDDLTLQAFADGELRPEQAAAVADWLQQHPAEAARVMGWQAQRAQLQALGREWLDEPLPAPLQDRLRAALRPVDTPRPAAPARGFGRSPWPMALAAGLLLVLGAGSGWWARSQWPGGAAAPQLAVLPAYVQDAAIAHAVFTPEQRHPVEVGVGEQAHLLQWLSRRLGMPLHTPDFSAQGFALVGGRLLPAGAGEATPPARAQFMYQDAQGARLTLYVSVLPPGPQAPAGFGQTQAGDTRSFYWREGRLGYALSGPVSQPRLDALAELAYRQLAPAPGGSHP